MNISRLLTRRILRCLATIKLAREKPTVIGITGSVGKTTTKEAIFAVLAHKFGGKIRRSAGNLNTEEGVPLAILGIDYVPSRFQYTYVLFQCLWAALVSRSYSSPILVLELAAEKPGDISYLVSFLRPYLKVGVVTTVGPIHLNEGQFSSLEAIAQEKGVLVEELPASGWALLNRDNPLTKKMAFRTKAHVVWFADRGLKTAFVIARAIGDIFHIKKREVEEALSSFKLPYGRLNELTGLKGTKIIDDSYNANPLSMEQALLFLGKKGGRKIAVLGDMLELGSLEKLYHQQIGKLARKKSDVVIGVGRRTAWYQPTYHFMTPLQAASFLRKFIRRGDAILVKGSQSMRMEIVSEALLGNPADVSRLPRQTPAWKAKKFIQP